MKLQSKRFIKRVLLALALMTIGVGGFAYFYARPLIVLYVVKSTISSRPELSLVPTPLPNTQFESSGGKRLVHYGYRFEVPWDEIVSERSEESFQAMEFTGGGALLVLNPVSQPDVFNTVQEAALRDGADLGAVFGADLAESNYALHLTVLQMTPADLRFSFSTRKMVRNSILLPLKIIWVNSKRTHGLYTFETPWVNGFQFGHPELDSSVVLDVYPDDWSHLTLSVSNMPNAKRKLSQAELNRIIYSIRQVSAEHVEPLKE